MSRLVAQVYVKCSRSGADIIMQLWFEAKSSPPALDAFAVAHRVRDLL